MFTTSKISSSIQSGYALDCQSSDRVSSTKSIPFPETSTERSQSLPERVVREMEILDSMHLGVMVVSGELKLVYQNLKAKAMSQELFLQDAQVLPTKLADACKLFLAESSLYPCDPFVLECYPSAGRKLQVQISWMDQRLIRSLPHQPYMLVVIKDCYQDLMAKTRREQKLYGFTDREAQIWMMLDLACSYQEIAVQLGISLNTVKTHVKNINVKRRNQPQYRLWFVDDSESC